MKSILRSSKTRDAIRHRSQMHETKLKRQRIYQTFDSLAFRPLFSPLYLSRSKNYKTVQQLHIVLVICASTKMKFKRPIYDTKQVQEFKTTYRMRCLTFGCSAKKWDFSESYGFNRKSGDNLKVLRTQLDWTIHLEFRRFFGFSFFLETSTCDCSKKLFYLISLFCRGQIQKWSCARSMQRFRCRASL